MRLKWWCFFHKIFGKRHENVAKMKIPKITTKHFSKTVYCKLNLFITWFFIWFVLFAYILHINEIEKYWPNKMHFVQVLQKVETTANL